MGDKNTKKGYHLLDWCFIKYIDKNVYCWCNNGQSNNNDGKWFVYDNIPKSYYVVNIFKHGKNALNGIRNEGGKIYKMPIYSANSYSVAFRSNGGTGFMPSQNFLYDKPEKIHKNTYKRKGLEFDGWFIYKVINNCKLFRYEKDNEHGFYDEGSEPLGFVKSKYVDGAIIKNLVDLNECQLFAEAQWKKKQAYYLVRYISGLTKNNLNEANISDSIMPVGKLAPTTKLKFERDGYKYNYWNLFIMKDGMIKFWCINKNNKRGSWIPRSEITDAHTIVNFNHGGDLKFYVDESTVIYFTPVWEKVTD